MIAATSPYFSASRSSSRRVSAGTDASSGRSTIGASTPSTSSRIAARSRLGREPAQELRRVHGWKDRRVLRLVLIGLAAGLFSALFGVGGGIVIVPLLLLFAHFEARPATATSLAAIGIISTVGVVSYALRGEVKPGAAAFDADVE